MSKLPISLPHNDIGLQTLPAPTTTSRVETGPVQFGSDWPGVFIRGDNAMYYAFVLSTVLKNKTLNIQDMFGSDFLMHQTLVELTTILSSCNVNFTKSDQSEDKEV